MIQPRLLGSALPRRTLALVLAVALLAPATGLWLASADAKDVSTPPTAAWNGRWSDDVLDVVAHIPVQAQGRVKPLHTWAGFALLSANHRRSCKDADDNKLTPLEWWLDAAFRPQHAKHHRCFLIPTSEILDAIGLTEVAKKKRDRYSYAELAPTPAARQKLSTMARRLHDIPREDRSRVEDGLVSLESSLRVFEGVLHMLDFTRSDLKVGSDAALKAQFGGKDLASFSEILGKAPELSAKVRAEMGPDTGHGAPRAKLSKEAQVISDVLNAAFMTTQEGLPIGVLPPSATAEDAPQWFAIRDVAGYAMMRGTLEPEHLQAIRSLEGMAASVGNDAKFKQHLESYQGRVQKLAEGRGEYQKIEQEVAFYELDPFGKCLVFYLIAFALIAVTWLRPGWRWLEIGGWVLLWGTLGLHTYGIVQRCIIRDRPPITGLYDTVIFISAAGVLTTLIIEHMNRQRVALALTPILGALGLFVAARYEVLEGRDTMPQLQAVLDTNFWLATHVTCISIGYCAGLVAGLIAHVYVLGKVFRWKQNDQAFYRSVGKMVYGVLCFALLFSLVGTILGGIWANDSWGRFWGWDPKENGALLICIAQIAILHGRMGGIFGIFGVCQGAILGGAIVAFSWWGVNLLNIGLHSYGFTTGVMRGLLIFYGIEGAVILAGVYAWMRDRPKPKVSRA